MRPFVRHVTAAAVAGFAVMALRKSTGQHPSPSSRSPSTLAEINGRVQHAD